MLKKLTKTNNHKTYALIHIYSCFGLLRHAAVDCYSKRVIASGIPLFDDNNHIINAHGASIIEDGGRYYMFGEWKSDTTNAFPGFSCYSSPDLANWKFEGVALQMQPDGILGPNRVGSVLR